MVLDGVLDGASASLLREEIRRVSLRRTLQSHVRGDDLLHMSEDDARQAGLVRLARAIEMLKGIAHETACAHGRRPGDLTAAPRARQT